MGYRTGVEPTAEQTFLERICNALDYTPHEIAKQIGVPYRELEPLLAPLRTVADINKDEVWWLISTLTDRRIAAHLAVKHELNVALDKQRKAQALRIAELKGRLPKSAPPRRPPLR